MLIDRSMLARDWFVARNIYVFILFVGPRSGRSSNICLYLDPPHLLRHKAWTTVEASHRTSARSILCQLAGEAIRASSA